MRDRRGGPRRAAPLAAAIALLAGAAAPGAGANGPRFGVDLETAALRFSRNDVRIPGDGGTEFDMSSLTGDDAAPVVRVGLDWRPGERHLLRLVLAPLEASGTGRLERETRFAGETFTPGPTRGTYKFNTYRLTWRYGFADRGPWRWGAGFTAVVRDANVELRQGARVANDDDLGFVPTLHLAGARRFGDRWTLGATLDGLAGGPGRLIDLALKLEYRLGDRWRVGGGYRTLEGGADTDTVYNFAWLHYATVDLGYRF